MKVEHHGDHWVATTRGPLRPVVVEGYTLLDATSTAAKLVQKQRTDAHFNELRKLAPQWSICEQQLSEESKLMEFISEYGPAILAGIVIFALAAWAA